MAQPSGFLDSQHPDYICKVQKSIYGLKQDPRAWLDRFTSHLLTLGFHASIADPLLFNILCQGKSVIYLLLYANDIILTSNDPQAISSPIAVLATTFELCVTFLACKLSINLVVFFCINQSISMIFFTSFTCLLVRLHLLPLYS